MGIPSPKRPKPPAQPESRRKAFDKLELLRSDQRAWGNSMPPTREFARYLQERFGFTGSDGGDLFQDLMTYLLGLEDPLTKVTADMDRLQCDGLRWLKNALWDIARKKWKKKSNRPFVSFDQVVEEHQEYLLTLESDADSIAIAGVTEVTANRDELAKAFLKDICDDPELGIVMGHISRMDGTCVKRKALAELLGVPIGDINKLMDRLAYRVKRFKKRFHRP